MQQKEEHCTQDDHGETRTQKEGGMEGGELVMTNRVRTLPDHYVIILLISQKYTPSLYGVTSFSADLTTRRAPSREGKGYECHEHEEWIVEVDEILSYPAPPWEAGVNRQTSPFHLALITHLRS